MLAFAEEYVKNGYNGSKAYRTAYGQENKTVCASEAYKLLRDPRIIAEIENVEGSFRILGQAAGVDKKKIVSVIAEMLDATKKDSSGKDIPDHAARKDAINIITKLTGDAKEKKELEIIQSEGLEGLNFDKMDHDELDRLEKELLDEL